MPLLWLSAAFLLGIVLADATSIPGWGWLTAAGASLALALAERFVPPLRDWRDIRLRFCPLPIGAVLVALALGGLRLALAQPVFTPADLAWYNDRGTAVITATVTAPPKLGQRSATLTLAASQISLLDGDGNPVETLPVHGTLAAYLPPGSDYRYGDRLELTGKPVAPQSTSQGYTDYLAHQGIYTTLSYPRLRLLERDTGSPLLAVIYSLRDLAHARLNHFLPLPESALLAGILLGIEENIPEDVERAFRDTGTAHIIAISGFNIAILVGLFFAIFQRLMRWTWAIPVALLVIALYTVLVGGGSSVVRAAVMGGVGLIGREIGRRQSGVNSLTFTAALMALFNPWLPWDISFQLSFTATLGLILFADPFQQAFIRLAEKRISSDRARRLAGPVGEYFLFTLAAQVMTLPVILGHFGRLSLSALVANPIILPVQALIMIIGGMAVLVGLVLAPLGQLLAWLVYPLLAFTIRAVELFARIPGGVVIVGEVGLAVILVYYLLVLSPATRLWANERFRAWLRPGLAIALLSLAAAVLWQMVLAQPDDKLHLTALNLSGGPALLLHTPGGERLLVNGSSNPNQLLDALGRRLPPLDARLDALLVTRHDRALLDGLRDPLGRYPARAAYWCAPIPTSPAANRLFRELEEGGAIIAEFLPGAVLSLGGGAQIEMQAGDKLGCAVLLTHGNLQALIPNGMAVESIPFAARQSANLLLLGDGDLAQAAAWSANGATILYLGRDAPQPGWNDLRGYAWVEIISDGKRLWVRGEAR